MTSKKLAELTYEEFFIKSKEGLSVIYTYNLIKETKGESFACDYLFDLCNEIRKTTKLTSEKTIAVHKEIVELLLSNKNISIFELLEPIEEKLIEYLDLNTVARILATCILDSFEISKQTKGTNFENESIKLIKKNELIELLVKNPEKIKETVRILQEMNTPENMIVNLIDSVNEELNKPKNFTFSTEKNYEGTVNFNGSYREEKFKPKFKFNKGKGITDEQHAFNLNQLVQIFELQDEELLEKYLEKVENILNEEFYPEYADKYFEMLLNGIVKILGGTR